MLFLVIYILGCWAWTIREMIKDYDYLSKWVWRENPIAAPILLIMVSPLALPLIHWPSLYKEWKKRGH